MKCVDAYREKTAHMNRQEKTDYIITYYWYHILGVAAAVGLILFAALRVLSNEQRPEFTCVLVNQAIDYDRDEHLEKMFAAELGLDVGQVVVDSDYLISYRDVQLSGVNESSYEKFFFKWDNAELDAVIIPESFFDYCEELGGSFRKLTVEGLPVYEDEGICRAIYVEQTALGEELVNETGEPLLLAFPTTGSNEENCIRFLNYIKEISKE